MKNAKMFTITVFAALLTACSTGGKATEQTPPTVKAAELSANGYTQKLTYSGTAKADETKNFSFLLSGKISSVEVEKGDPIKKGQVLAKLDTESVDLAINNANEDISKANNQIEQLKNNIEVQKLTLEKSRLAIDAEKINLKKTEDTYNSQIATIQLSYNNTKADYDRAVSLHDNGYISDTDFEQAKLAMDTVTEQLNTAKENMANDVELENKSIENMENDYKLQETAVKNSQTQLDAAYIALNQAKIALEQSNKSLNDSTLVSTMDGFVTEVVMKSGEVTSAGAPVVCVKSGEQVINIGVGTADYPKLSLDMDAEVIYNSKSYKGKITNIANYPDEATRTYNVEITPQNCDVAMGTLVSVEIPIGEAAGCFIPISSVFNTNGADYVYALQEDGYGYYRTVKTEVILDAVDGDTILAKNLDPGTIIVSEGITDVSDNQQVNINFDK